MLEGDRVGLENLLRDPGCDAACQVQVKTSLKEIDTALNVIAKTPVIADATEVAWIAADIAGFGAWAVGKAITSKLVQQYFATKVGKEISEDAAARIAANFYRDGIPYDVRRIAYESRTDQLGAQAKAMLTSGQSEEVVARWIHAQRNQLKIEFRDISPPEFVAKAEARNIEKYGNPLGPTIDQLRSTGQSWSDIIRSATRSGRQDFGFGAIK